MTNWVSTIFSWSKKITSKDHDLRKQYALEILSRIDDDETYLDRLSFPDAATFHVCVTVNMQNRRVFRSENPQDVIEHKRDSSKVNVWFAMMKNKVISPSCFEEPTVTGDTFLAVMDNTALCHVPAGTVSQSDSAPTHFSRRVSAFVDREFPDHL
jgi:hypothetical protein